MKVSAPGSEQMRRMMRSLYYTKSVQQYHQNKAGATGNEHNTMAGTPWDFGPDVTTLKLSMIILVYLFYQDDQKFSFSEKGIVKKTIKSIPEFSEKDRKELLKCLDEKPDKAYINTFMLSNEIQDATFHASIEFVISNIKLNKRYQSLLEDLKALR
jgi:hypothetical protein